MLFNFRKKILFRLSYQLVAREMAGGGKRVKGPGEQKTENGAPAKKKKTDKETENGASGRKNKTHKETENGKPAKENNTKKDAKKGTPAKESKTKKETEIGAPAKKNKTQTEWNSVDWKCSSVQKPWDLKLASWNVDGLRACVSKGGAELLSHEMPDVLCLQETKVTKEKLPTELQGLTDYPHSYWLSAEKDGYSGVGLLSKTEPLSVQYGFGEDDIHDKEGRMITAEFSTFYLVTTYVPNAGRKLITLDKRMDWDPKLRNHLVELDKKKPVIVCGDMNVAHQELDLKNPKSNKKNAGFTQEERDGFTELLGQGFTDTWRHLNPDKEECYTFWTYMMNCRAKNVGWRLDYFLVSSRLMDNVADCIVRDKVFGSDHCPITLLLKVTE